MKENLKMINYMVNLKLNLPLAKNLKVIYKIVKSMEWVK